MLKKKLAVSKSKEGAYVDELKLKPIDRLTSEEVEFLRKYYQRRLKGSKRGMYVAEGTHVFTYQPQQELERSMIEHEEENEVVMHALQPRDAQPDIWEVIRSQIARPRPCGGGRRVGLERFKGINSELGWSNSKE